MVENALTTADNQVATRSTVQQIKEMLNQDAYKKRFYDVLGKKAEKFTGNIVTAVSSSNSLKACNPQSILSAAFIAATLDLSIDSNLGFAALVPYDRSYQDDNGNWKKEKHAQFQIMYKGLIQLAIRTGLYEKMSCSEVYADELKSYNPITGECEFITDFAGTTQRISGDTDKIIGYYAWFRLKSGFVKEMFMTKEEVMNHAMKYSQSYRSDQKYGKAKSNWSTDFDSMAKKTVIKQLLSKWGILSIDMQTAITEDQKVYDEEGNGEYADNQPEVIEPNDPFDNAPEFLHEPKEEFEDFDITG